MQAAGGRSRLRSPQLVTRLKKIYPQAARELNVEARLMAGVVIADNGVLKWAKVVWINLSKELPKEATVKLKKEFYGAARQILLGAQFTPGYVNSKAITVRMEQPLNFVLD